MSYFTAEQVSLLLKPIHPKRVSRRDGMSYVEGYDIKAELNRVFGFGRWSAEILGQSLICETAKKMSNGKDGWYVAYRTSLRLTVKAPDGTPLAVYEESHVGDSTHPVQGEAHGNALTNSWTYALKRCATNLGDQFGLSLYGKGSMDALVRWTLNRPEASGADQSATDTDDVPQVAPEGDAGEPDDAGEVNRIAAEQQPRDKGYSPRQGNGRTSIRAEDIPPPDDARNGTVSRPRPKPVKPPDGINFAAQSLAEMASKCTDMKALEDVQAKARNDGKLSERVCDPDTGVIGALAGYINYIRRSIQEADAPRNAPEPAGATA